MPNKDEQLCFNNIEETIRHTAVLFEDGDTDIDVVGNMLCESLDRDDIYILLDILKSAVGETDDTESNQEEA